MMDEESQRGHPPISGGEDVELPSGRRWRLVLAFIGACILLLLDNPFWDLWTEGYKARDVVRTNRPGEIEPEDVVLEDAGSLGSFPYRPLVHRVESCSKIHRLAREGEKPLECEGLRRMRGDTDLCGGIPMIPGLCVLPEKVTFMYRNEQEKNREWVAEVKETSKTVQGRPICSNDTASFAEGSFSNYRYHGSKCELVDVNPKWMLSKFRGNVIVFMGDSHARNLFTSFVAEIRNQKFVLERHPDVATKDTLFPYQKYEIFPTKDYLVDLTGSKSLTFESVRAGTKENCQDPNSEKCSVTVLFLWAGFPAEYESLLKTSLSVIRPDVIITDFISKPYTTAVGFENSLKLTMGNLEHMFSGLNKIRGEKSPPVPFFVSPFPLFGGDEVREAVRKWFNERREVFVTNRIVAHLLDQTQFISAYDRTTGRTMDQMKSTSHTVCALYDAFSLNPNVATGGGHKIKGFENCIAPIDRAIMRAAFTFASQDIKV